MRWRHGRVETSGFCLHLGPVGPIENCSGLTLRTFIIVPMGAQVATVPLWSGMVTSQVSTGWSALSPSLKSTVGGWGGFSGKVGARESDKTP